jgi:hypothetical protein
MGKKSSRWKFSYTSTKHICYCEHFRGFVKIVCESFMQKVSKISLPKNIFTKMSQVILHNDNNFFYFTKTFLEAHNSLFFAKFFAYFCWKSFPNNYTVNKFYANFSRKFIFVKHCCNNVETNFSFNPS